MNCIIVLVGKMIYVKFSLLDYRFLLKMWSAIITGKYQTGLNIGYSMNNRKALLATEKKFIKIFFNWISVKKIIFSKLNLLMFHFLIS